MREFNILIFGIFLIIRHSVHGSDAEQNLSEILTRNLTQHSPPSDLFNDTVYVHVDLIKFLNIDQKSELIFLTILLTIKYHVPRISWDAGEFGGIEDMYFPPDFFWSPQIG